MLKKFPFLFFISIAFTTIAQDSLVSISLDNRYREDQFYAGVTYNLIGGVPSSIDTRGVTGGFFLGFIRDVPINPRRNFALGLGLGLAFDAYGQNLFIGERENETTIFNVLENGVDYSSNRFSTAAIEVPFEFRWRTSDASTYKFWRIYTGVKMSYLYWYRSFFEQTGNQVAQTNIPELWQLQFAFTISAGYSTFNFYLNYGITPFFENAFIEETQEEVLFRPLKLGVVFYIL